ncbi:MAG: hypothetical protein KDC85_21810 [Saprospiraceae bacterium]|nr:hypothetical protein [Saprospiraceae bacterium]MCB9324218.1 hypothetical protein [Lewinellaceae bacterium]
MSGYFSIIPILFLWLAVQSVATGQTIPENYDTPEKRCAIITDEMIKELPLQPGEVPVFRALNLKYAKIVQKEILDQEISWWSAYFKMKEINQKKERELLPLLSDKQIENYERMKADARQLLWEMFLD